MRYFHTALILFCLAVFGLAGWRGMLSRRPPIEVFSDMVRQPKLRPETHNAFFTNHISSQEPVVGAIARSAPIEWDGQVLGMDGRPVYPYEDIPVNTGRIPGYTNWADTNPLPLTRSLLDRGQERFQIHCSPCHGAAGDGRGITSKYNMAGMANFHDKRLIDMTDGEIFNTITHGKNLMKEYGTTVPMMDRWAIIAYIRALQRSQLGSIEDAPPAYRSMFQK